MDFSGFILLFTALNKHQVQSLVVGGMTVAFYGYFRLSTNTTGEIVEKPDIAIWYNPTYDNYFKLLSAIGELGKDVKKYKDETTPDLRNSFFKFDFDSFSLDLLPRISAPFKFSEAFARREVFESSGLEISFISRNDLIADKRVTGRPKDLDDISHLLIE